MNHVGTSTSLVLLGAFLIGGCPSQLQSSDVGGLNESAERRFIPGTYIGSLECTSETGPRYREYTIPSSIGITHDGGYVYEGTEIVEGETYVNHFTESAIEYLNVTEIAETGNVTRVHLTVHMMDPVLGIDFNGYQTITYEQIDEPCRVRCADHSDMMRACRIIDVHSCRAGRSSSRSSPSGGRASYVTRTPGHAYAKRSGRRKHAGHSRFARSSCYRITCIRSGHCPNAIVISRVAGPS